MRKFTATLFLLATLSLGCLAVGAVPAMAEENVGNVSVMTEYGPYSFKMFQYPSRETGFLFFQNSFVEFEAVHGSYWMIEMPYYGIHTQMRAFGATLLGGGSREISPIDNFTVAFYSPEHKLVGKLSNVRPDKQYSFPRFTENYDKLYVRIESRAIQNVNAKFMVWEPVDPVVAKPLGAQSIITDKK